MTDVTQYDLWIGGEYQPPETGRYFDDLNPLDDSPIAAVAEAGEADVNAAVEAAHTAFSSYRKSLAKERELWLIRAADLLEQRRDQVIETLIDEGGSTIGKANFELGFATGFLRAAAGVARRITGEVIPSDSPGRYSFAIRQPVGVVAGVIPFNVPLIKCVKQSAMALATGNSFVLLTSEEAPLIGHILAEVYAEAGFPAGVYNVLTGYGHKIGDFLTGHPKVKSITFTGSTRVGQHIAELAARQFKPCTLELGGKSPMIVLKDADIDAAVHSAVMGVFLHQGQACMCASRIYVEQSVADEFKQKFAAAAAGLSAGDLWDPSTVIGPIISGRQRDRVRTHLTDAIEKGATVLAGGGEWDGNRCPATVLGDVTDEMTLYREETFGPVTAVYVVESLEQALEQANDTEYGLSASVFTNDLNSALELAHELEAGMVHINAPSLYDEPSVPFGGWGKSGVGREGTEADLEAMTQWKWITIQTPVAGGDGH
ncbi:MAG: aldehyde dehydrogenase family protein [Gammaproteobacteria bacterium]|nr:aldehyde dehydrogenase family protein [Gammaproteobacteria bacterium]